jgi:hypothetical protein
MKKYIYRNEAGRPINIGGYQFAAGAKLASDIIIEQFKEAVSNGFLSFQELKEDKQLKASLVNPEEEARKVAEAEAARKAEEERLSEEAKKAEEKRLAAEEAAKQAADGKTKKAAEADAVKSSKEK